MKIIDLLNKIANEEEVPKKIKYENIIYAYSEYDKDYLEYPFSDEEYKGLFDMRDNILTQFLNDEIEILDELKENKIGKLNTNIINANRYDYDKNKEMTIFNIAADILSISKVVNELIDEINNLKEND